jgi:hypothetical protein
MQAMLTDQCSDLSNLINLRVSPLALQGQELRYAGSTQDVVAPARALLKSHASQQKRQSAALSGATNPVGNLKT